MDTYAVFDDQCNYMDSFEDYTSAESFCKKWLASHVEETLCIYRRSCTVRARAEVTYTYE